MSSSILPFFFDKTTTPNTICALTNQHTELAQLFIVSCPNMAQNPLIIPHHHSITQARQQIQTTTMPPPLHDIPNHGHSLNSSVQSLTPTTEFPLFSQQKKECSARLAPFVCSLAHHTPHASSSFEVLTCHWTDPLDLPMSPPFIRMFPPQQTANNKNTQQHRKRR